LATNELIRTLLNLLKSTFASSANADDIVSVEPAKQVGGPIHFVAIGGSNLSKVSKEILERGHKITDLTKPGWVPNPANISCLVSDLDSIPLENTVIIADLLGNVTYRYEQLDGTLAMPYKTNGKFHLSGEVKVCAWPTLRSLIDTLKPIFTKIQVPIVFLSPLPRYLYSGCCDDREHFLKVNTPSYKETLLREVIALQNICSDQLQVMGVKNCAVPNMVAGMMPACTGVREYVTALQHLMAEDGVHFSGEGYRKISDTIIAANEKISLSAASPYVSGAAPQTGKSRILTEYYWRGFTSPVGTPRPKNHAEAYKLTHGARGGGKWPDPSSNNKNRNLGTPYRGGGGRGGRGGRGR